MGRVCTEIDLRPDVDDARAAVTDRPLRDALFGLARLSKPLDPDVLRQKVEDELGNNPTLAAMPFKIVDNQGRIVANAPAAASENEGERGSALQQHMMRHAGLCRGVAARGRIVPALRIIRDEHVIEPRAIETVLKGCSFIPDERIEFFTRGIVAGLSGDFLVALHLLVPKVEHALRCVLQQRGVIPSSIDTDGIEEVWPLPRILREEALDQAFGHALAWDLNSVLLEKAGPNLRNRLAHGLLGPIAFRDDAAIYTWWLLFHLCMMSHRDQGAYFDAKCTGKSEPRPPSRAANSGHS